MDSIGDFLRRYDGVRTADVPDAQQERYVRRTWAARDARRRGAEDTAQGPRRCFVCGEPLDAATSERLVRDGYNDGLCRDCADYVERG